MYFLVTYLAGMLVPGALLSELLGAGENRAANAIALSLAFMVSLLVLARFLGIGPAGFGWLVLSGCLAMAAVLGWRARTRRWAPPKPRVDAVWAIPVLTFALIVVYGIWAGPYTEVPADAWWHIGEIRDRYDSAASGNVGLMGNLDLLFDKYAGYWYTIVGIFLALTETEPVSALSTIAMGNTLLFCGGVYSFALYVFSNVEASRAVRHWMAAATVLFFFTQFGISVFSYVRYYVFAPTLMNYVVYLSAIFFFLSFVGRDRGGYGFAVAAALLAVVAAMVHKQEALFVVVMSGTILLVMFLWGLRPATGPERETNDGRKRVAVLLAAFVVAYLLAHAWAYTTLVRHDPLAHGLLADIRHYAPFIQNLYVLKPTYQFYQVVTVWGVLVYVLFAYRFRRFRGSPYLVAGMIVPLLTVFNPVFTDFFLRFSWPEVLWRMCFMLPLPFLGGYFLVESVKTGFHAPGVIRRSAGLFIAFLLLVLLLPIKTTYFVSPYSKIYTLEPVEDGNNYVIWNDVLQFLDTVDSARIITDPVTGYVINGLTDHKYPGYKFYESPYILKVNENEYTGADFRHKKDWLVVVNMRDGAGSETGRYGRHWREEIMLVSRRYSSEFLSYVEDRPEVFSRIWSREGMTVYRVQPQQGS